ncbi:ATP-dependent helicase NAM7 [Cichlidogyrus casuarinus]|uniref:ATP-dependent helicase NAM7 n=1 Tax=Cichlidogyrus casuarinus TaxID=1844966 RepID=A0ABD2Q365_9PLAT
MVGSARVLAKQPLWNELLQCMREQHLLVEGGLDNLTEFAGVMAANKAPYTYKPGMHLPAREVAVPPAMQMQAPQDVAVLEAMMMQCASLYFGANNNSSKTAVPKPMQQMPLGVVPPSGGFDQRMQSYLLSLQQQQQQTKGKGASQMFSQQQQQQMGRRSLMSQDMAPLGSDLIASLPHAGVDYASQQQQSQF